MKLTIIAPDNAVYVDGISISPLDLSTCGIPENVWVLQWNQSQGWIEFADNSDGTKPANEPIFVLPDWANACLEVYNAWTPEVIAAPIVSQPTTTGTQTI